MSVQTDQRSHQIVAVLTAFLSLFAVVGFALYGLPRFYPYFVQELGWSRAQVTSGNAYSKIFVALAFGFLAGRLVDRVGPRRLMLGGIVMAGGALIGLSYVTSLGAFYFFYTFNALGYVFGGPLPNQVLLSRWFDKGSRQGDGHRLSRHRRRRRARAAAGVLADAGLRLARRAAHPRPADDRHRAADGVLRPRAGESRHCSGGRVARSICAAFSPGPRSTS